MRDSYYTMKNSLDYGEAKKIKNKGMVHSELCLTGGWWTI